MGVPHMTKLLCHTPNVCHHRDRPEEMFITCEPLLARALADLLNASFDELQKAGMMTTLLINFVNSFSAE